MKIENDAGRQSQGFMLKSVLDPDRLRKATNTVVDRLTTEDMQRKTQAVGQPLGQLARRRRPSASCPVDRPEDMKRPQC